MPPSCHSERSEESDRAQRCVIPSVAMCHSERSEESERVAPDPSRGAGRQEMPPSGHSERSEESDRAQRCVIPSVAMCHSERSEESERDAPDPSRGAGRQEMPPSGHSERSEESDRAQRGIGAGRARPLARRGVTMPDGHRILVIPSAARNLSGSGTTPRFARGDRAGWSQDSCHSEPFASLRVNAARNLTARSAESARVAPDPSRGSG
jgi:hypothetical protein